MTEIPRLLGIIFQATTVEGEEIAYLTETLLYRARDNVDLSFDVLQGITTDSGASATMLEEIRGSIDEFIGVFNEDFHDAAATLGVLHEQIQARLATFGPGNGRGSGSDSESSLSDSVGLRVSGDSSSHQEPPWLERYFMGPSGAPNAS